MALLWTLEGRPAPAASPPRSLCRAFGSRRTVDLTLHLSFGTERGAGDFYESAFLNLFSVKRLIFTLTSLP